MKRRKIAGLILIISTFVYFIACLLALYQNQRVTMEKGIEEAIKAYSSKENQNFKELSEDFKHQLNNKMDMKDGNLHILKFEGSFDRMEKNITNVTDEMARVEYNITNLDERLTLTENFYNQLYQEMSEKHEFYEQQYVKINEDTTQINKTIEELKTQITKLEQQITENIGKQEENLSVVSIQLEELITRVAKLSSNALLYQYDANTQTLHVYGDKGEETNLSFLDEKQGE